MAGTFTQIYIHIIFAVKHRDSLISAEWEDELHKYITGIVQSKEQKMLAINGMPDHIHFLIGMKPTCCLSDLIREVKKSFNELIKDKKLTPYQFEWQKGYGAFSYSHSQLDKIIGYIMNQKEHHRKMNFKDEHTDFLKAFNVAHDEQYLFDWM